MSRTYEFLKNEMSYVDKDVFERGFRKKICIEYMPDIAIFPELMRYIIKGGYEEILYYINNAIITVEVKKLAETDKFRLEWKIGFSGLEFRVDCFAIEEELHSFEEIENVAMWLTCASVREIEWKEAVDKLFEMFGEVE